MHAFFASHKSETETLAEIIKKRSLGNYGHDDFIIGLLLDITPHVEEQLLIDGVKHPQTWNRAWNC